MGDEAAHVSLATLRVPGYSADDIKLEAHEGRLSIELSSCKGDKSGSYWLMLPEALKDPSDLIAVCQDGILGIKYPKTALRQPVERSVEISATRAEESRRLEMSTCSSESVNSWCKVSTLPSNGNCGCQCNVKSKSVHSR